MKIVAIFGSPRKGNSDALAEEFIIESEQHGAEVEKYYLREMTLKGCLACGACKSGKSDKCIIQDDLSPVLDSILRTDVVLISTPVYFSDLPWLVKSFIDRWYSFIGFNDEGYHFRIDSGKKMVFILTQAKSKDLHTDIPGRYNSTFMEFGFEKMYLIHEGGLRDHNGVNKSGNYLHIARETARELLSGKDSKAEL